MHDVVLINTCDYLLEVYYKWQGETQDQAGCRAIAVSVRGPHRF